MKNFLTRLVLNETITLWLMLIATGATMGTSSTGTHPFLENLVRGMACAMAVLIYRNAVRYNAEMVLLDRIKSELTENKHAER